jgi:asparagine synthase (glutamine-hydrolysing)
MDGICAVLGPNSEHLIKRLCGSLQHRGPDDEGFFIGTNLALGHRALKITNIPVPHQPLANEDETIWITFDGEIYNKGQLIEQLEKNHTFETNSSAEVALYAYEEDGANCVSRFNGMFAFCLWDSTKEQLFCARDRIGIKPLYYYDCPSLFILASEIKALLSVSSVPRKPNERVIYDYLVSGHHHYPADTFFLGIKSLLPAHQMFVDHNGIRIQRYWDPVKPLETDRLTKDAQSYASEFRELLRDSVKIRIPANISFGTFLSGGLDSPSIACLINDILYSTPYAKTISDQRQELFSAIYPISQDDERPYIEEVLRALATKTNYVFPSVAGRWNDIRQFIYFTDEPVPVFNYYVWWCLSRKAKEKVKEIFYGSTGGEIYGALDILDHYRRYFKKLWRKRKIGKLLIELVGVLPRVSISSIANTFSRRGESEIKNLLAPCFLAHFIDVEQIEDVTLNGEYHRFRDGMCEDCRVFDRLSSAFSIESRHPLLDHRIVEFFFSLPTTQRIRKGRTKYVFRNAMKGIIPEAVRKNRKKFGTPIPLERWIRELRGNIRKIFESSKFRERGYFNQPAILDAYDRFCEGKMNRFSSARYAELFWRILNLELWLEMFFDSKNEIKLADFCGESVEDHSR